MREWRLATWKPSAPARRHAPSSSTSITKRPKFSGSACDRSIATRTASRSPTAEGPTNGSTSSCLPSPARKSASSGSARRMRTAGSELDVVVEGSRVRPLEGAQNGPVMKVAVIARLLACPAEVGQAEGDRAGDRRQLVVVDEDDSAAADEPAEIDEVEKDGVKAVVAVDERQIEAAAVAQEARQDDLRLLGMMLDEFGKARFLDGHEPAAAEPRLLVRVDR